MHPLLKWVYHPEEGISKSDGEKVIFEAPKTLKIYFPHTWFYFWFDRLHNQPLFKNNGENIVY